MSTSSRPHRWLSLLLLIVLLAPSLPLQAQESQPSETLLAGRQAPNQEQIQERIGALEQATNLNETLRNQALSLYRSAAERIAAAETYTTAAERYRKSAAAAPAQTQRLHDQLAQLRAAPPVEREPLFANAPSRGDIRNLLTQKRAEYATLQSRLKDLEEQLRTQQSRPLAAREELNAAKQRRDEADTGLQTPLGDAESERVREARLTALAAQRHAGNSQVSMLEQELLTHDARLALLTAQRDLVALQLQQEGARLKRIQELANLQSRAEAAQAAEAAARATRETWGRHTVLTDVAQLNADYSKQLSELIVLIERSTVRQDRISQQLEQINKSYQSTRQQLEIAGLNDALGAALRRERAQLPDLHQYARTERQRQDHITQARLAQFQIEQQRRELLPPAQDLKELMQHRVDPALADEERSQVQQELSALLRDRNALVDELATNYNRYIDLLTDLHRDQEQLVTQASQFATLLDESLFWIASSAAIGLDWLPSLASSAIWLLDAERWQSVTQATLQGAEENAAITVLVLLLAALLFRARPRIRDRLHADALNVDRVHSDRFAHTLEALALTPLLALPWPLLLYLLGWLVARPLELAPFPNAVGQSLQTVAFAGFLIETFRQVSRREGLGQAHFRWSEQSRRVLLRNLTWLLIVSLPTAFLISLTEWLPEQQHRDSLGRLAFIGASLALALFASRVLHPRLGAVLGMRQQKLHGATWWLRYIGYPLAVALPLLLAAMAAYGYYYTALQLQSRFFSTGAMLVAAGIAINLAVRWLRLMERRIALLRARARRDASDSAEAAPEYDEEPMDLATVDEQNRGLLKLLIGAGVLVGLWVIWIDLLPALNVLNEVVLWQHASADGDRLIPITLVDLILASGICVFTLVAARNLPAIFEVSVLPRLSIDAGTRYAITAISRYVIITVGLLGAVSLLGISWSKAQWLVAALGLGLGFGLQEIFANFVSGLIILFERPVRVGDTVTVGELSGTVSRIRIRATTITDWERREIIIPNKAFITERLINWTLSDQVTRVVVKVRVAYNTDPDLAHRLILAVATANPRVRDDPEPTVFLTSFGDNALSFELRAFVSDMDDRFPLTHELHVGIVHSLREHGIEIPLPQRDLHIRSRVIGPGTEHPAIPTLKDRTA